MVLPAQTKVSTFNKGEHFNLKTCPITVEKGIYHLEFRKNEGNSFNRKQDIEFKSYDVQRIGSQIRSMTQINV